MIQLVRLINFCSWARIVICLVAVALSSQAAPVITLTATSFIASLNRQDVYSVSGPGFALSGSEFGEGYFLIPLHPGDQLEGSVDATATLQGFIEVGGVSRGVLFNGRASTPVGFAVVPSITENTILSVPLTISGSFTGCLQLGDNVNSPCDPKFLNYLTLNINLEGQYNYFLEPTGNGSPYYPLALYRETYMATAPEPASLGLVVASPLLLILVIAGVKRHHQSIGL